MRYQDLSRYEGREVDFLKGFSNLTELEDTRLPDKCVFLKDFEKTVLLEWIYIQDGFGITRKPRSFKKMVSKASMYVGDVLIRADRPLTGSLVRS